MHMPSRFIWVPYKTVFRPQIGRPRVTERRALVLHIITVVGWARITLHAIIIPRAHWATIRMLRHSILWAATVRRLCHQGHSPGRMEVLRGARREGWSCMNSITRGQELCQARLVKVSSSWPIKSSFSNKWCLKTASWQKASSSSYSKFSCRSKIQGTIPAFRRSRYSQSSPLAVANTSREGRASPYEL